jgi:hypothetical protein
MKTKLSAVMVLLLCLAGCMHAQTIQTTWQQPVFANQTTNGSSTANGVIIRNLNQSAHWVFYCSTSLTSTLNIVLQGSSDNVHWVNISNIGSTVNGCDLIQGGGYFPALQVVLSNVTGGSPSINAWYSATTGVTSTPSNAGKQLTSELVTLLPANMGGTNTGLKSSPYTFQNVPVAVYIASFSNPNAGAVYCAVSGTSSNPFTTNPANVYMAGIPAGGSVSLNIPDQGLYLIGLYAACSTSATTATDPASGVVVTVAYKFASSLGSGGVVN